MRTCAGAILIKNGDVLLGLRSHQSKLCPNTWDIFGGHCEAGETVEDTLVRELEEELGIRPVQYEALGVFAEPNPHMNGEAQYYVFVVYEWLGEPENLGSEHQLIKWFSINELNNINLASEYYIELFSQLGTYRN